MNESYKDYGFFEKHFKLDSKDKKEFLRFLERLSALFWPSTLAVVLSFKEYLTEIVGGAVVLWLLLIIAYLIWCKPTKHAPILNYV